MIVKLLTEHNLKFLGLKGGCRGSSESTHVKMQHCWKSHALALIVIVLFAGTPCPSQSMMSLVMDLCILHNRESQRC